MWDPYLFNLRLLTVACLRDVEGSLHGVASIQYQLELPSEWLCPGRGPGPDCAGVVLLLVVTTATSTARSCHCGGVGPRSGHASRGSNGRCHTLFVTSALNRWRENDEVETFSVQIIHADCRCTSKLQSSIMFWLKVWVDYWNRKAGAVVTHFICQRIWMGI